MQLSWKRGFFRVWALLALTWVSFMGWHEYGIWDNYFISASRGFPSFPYDYAQIRECSKPFAIPLSTIWPEGQPFAGWKGGDEADFRGIDWPPQFRDAWGRAHVIVGSPGSKDYLDLVGRLPCVTCPASISKYDPFAAYADYVPSPEDLTKEAADEAAADRALRETPLKNNPAWPADSSELRRLWRGVMVGWQVNECWHFAPTWQRIAFEVSENWPLVNDSVSHILLPPLTLLVAGYIFGWIVRGFRTI
jgi:hypothetical protein